jgi:tripartite-type tricarboxylate transporter receptor subunit TctC
MLTRRQFTTATTASAAGLLSAGWPTAGRAQPMPDTLRLLCGYPPGGTSDAVTRRIAEKLQGPYARVAVVDNKAGASGRLAIEELKRGAPDGSVMLLTPASAISLVPHIYNRLSYSAADVTPVCTAARFGFGFGVGPAVPASVRTLTDYVAWVKQNPGQGNYGSPGNGTPPHFLGAMLGKEAGIDMRHVPYRGSAPGIQDLLGGQLQAMSSPIGDYLPYLKDGKLRVLATSGATRSRFVPDAGTYVEQGFKSLVMTEYYEIFMPAKAPAEAVQRAADAIRRAVAAPEVVDAFARFGLEPAPGTPAELAQLVRNESAQWGPIVKRVGFTPEN